MAFVEIADFDAERLTLAIGQALAEDKIPYVTCPVENDARIITTVREDFPEFDYVTSVDELSQTTFADNCIGIIFNRVCAVDWPREYSFGTLVSLLTHSSDINPLHPHQEIINDNKPRILIGTCSIQELLNNFRTLHVVGSNMDAADVDQFRGICSHVLSSVTAIHVEGEGFVGQWFNEWVAGRNPHI